MAGMNSAADLLVWVCLPKEKFRPGASFIVPVLAQPSKICCQLYSSSWMGLKEGMVPMAPTTGGYISHLVESDLVGLPPELLIC